MNGKLKVWYLFHSSYALEAGNRFLIFDYYIDKPEGESGSLAAGVLEPREIARFDTLVFSSHRHPDHFNPVIFSWRNQIKSVRYVLSSDIPSRFRLNDDTITVKPRQTVETPDGIVITSLKSTDEGVAFLIDIGGIKIYHAGDLNWWHWEEESKAWNSDMAARFKREMETLKGLKIDIAFITTDPRQKSDSLLGLEYFARNIGAKWIFPMHFGGDLSIMEIISRKKEINPDLKSVQTVLKRGQLFEVTV